MNKKEIEALALRAAERIKTEQDLNDFSRLLKKITVEAALGVELDEHLACLSLPAAGRQADRATTSTLCQAIPIAATARPARP